MGAKRKSTVSAKRQEQPQPKRARKPKETTVELTGAQFKAMLCDPSAAMKGLETFIAIAKLLPSEDQYDVVEGYIKVSVECAEILKLLDGERRPENEVLLIFQALESILLRTASDLSHFRVVGMNIVKKLINSYMKLIYAALYSENHRMSRLCLTLLSAMVTQGPDAARDIYSHFDFNNKFLPSLAKRRDYKGKPDVRMAYIQYALSFLIAGDNTILVHILELKDFIPDIFRAGLKEDRISTISLLLSTLASKVVHNKNITKTQKVRFFTVEVLNHIASLYRWNGITDVSTEDVKDTLDSEEAGKVIVRELVHNFLMDLCCSLKHGINFYDPSLGTSGRAGNLVLLRFLLSLKTAAEDEMVADLVVNIFKVCPDLLNRYFKESQYSFAPRLKSAWLDNIKLLRKIYEAQPEVSHAFKTAEFIPLPRLLPVVMVTTIPAVCNKAMFTQGLNIPNKTVKHTILSLMATVLKRALKNIEYCLNEKEWEKSEIYTQLTMQEFVQQYREALSKLLPDMTNIVAVWQSLLKQEKEQVGQKRKKEDASSQVEEMTEVKETNGEHGSEDAETTLLKAVLLHVICLYQQIVPHLVAQSNFDFSKLIKGIVTEEGLRQEVPPVLQHHILKVALELPANKFSWFKIQDEAERVCGERSVFYLLMKMFVTSNHPQLKASAKKLIIKVLHDSGIFEYTWKELELWLEHLDNTAEGKKEGVIQFLEKILVKLVTNPYPYTDKAADFVQEASVLQVNLFKQDVDNVSIPVSHIDDALDMIDVLMEGSEGLDEEIGSALNEDMIMSTFPFSAVVPAALEVRNKLLLEADENARGDSIVEYLVAIFTDLLHSQRDPLALCLMFQLHDKELQSSAMSSYPQLSQFSHYYSLWIPQQAKEILLQQARNECADKFRSPDSSFSSLLKNTYEKGVAFLLEEAIQEKLSEAISQLQPHQLLLASKHVLLYLKTTVENFSSLSRNSGPSLLTLFVDLLKSLLHKGKDTELRSQQELKNAQTESDLFMDEESLIATETTNHTIMENLLPLIFRHPILENWFLAVEQDSLPHHSLSPITVRQLSVHLSHGILELLKIGCQLLQDRSQLAILSRYFDAVTKNVLEELHTRRKGGFKIHSLQSLQLEALQELHMYMDVQQLREVALAMLQLPKAILANKKSEKEACLSIYGKLLVQLLTESYQRGSLNADLFLSREHIQGIGLLLSTAATEELEKVFIHALQNEPVFAQAVGVDVQLFCLHRATETSISIVALLIQYCRTHLLQFELWCLTQGTGKLLKKSRGLFLPLVNTYLQCGERHGFTRPSKVTSAVESVLRDALWSDLLNIILDQSASQPFTKECQVLSKLLPPSETEAFTNLAERLPVLLEAAGSHERWVIADAISRVLESSAEKLQSWRRRILASCIKSLIATYSNSKEQETHSENESAMLSRLQKLLHSVMEVAPEDWCSFVTMGLRFRYKDQDFLKTLNVAINLLYQEEVSLSQRLVKLSVLYMMITQHSLFLSTMLRSREDDTNVLTREALVDVLLTLVKYCPAVCESTHFAVLLGAYGATLSTLDQKILLLLRLYEKNGLSLVNYRILLWGPAAVEHHKTCKSLGKSLWQQPSMEEILCLLDQEVMMRTILQFPQHQHLLPPEEEQILLNKSKREVDLNSLYDPRFLLQLFSELLRPECVVACFKFVEVNALGLAVAALSSYDSNMRSAAYYVLGSFRSHLEGARFREQRQLLYLMDVVQNGIKQPNLRLTFPLTLYIARAANQMLRPEEHMYTKLNKFLLSHQYLDLKKVPGFFQLFYSFDLEHKMEREWVLAIIGEGLRDKHCYELYDYHRIFHVLLSFFHNPLCCEATQLQILEILQNGACITKAAYELIRDHSLLTWVLFILEKRFLENKVLNHVISLLHTLWITNLGDKQKLLGTLHKKELQENQKFLPLQLVNEFLHVLIALLKHIRANLDFAKLIQFFSTLSSVFKYRVLVIEAFREMGRFTVNEHVLSNKDVLLLLHKWSIIGKDEELQDDLQTLAHQYQTKELLKNIKEKTKTPFRTSSQLIQKKKNEVKTEGEETAFELKLFDSEECKSAVRSILVHWEPVFPDTPAKLAKKQNGYSHPGLTCKMGYLVFKWLVKSLVDSTFSVQNVLMTFKWFKKNVLPNTTVVEEILKDGTLRSAIFKLYSSINDASEEKTLDLSDLSLLNTIMLHLLDSQELTKNDFCGTLKQFCLSAMNEEDLMKKAAAIFITSVYIGDIWLGAEQPEMFLTHVKLMCGVTDGKPNGDYQKIWDSKEAMISLSRDILLFLNSLS